MTQGDLSSQSHEPPDHRCPHGLPLFFLGWQAPEGQRERAEDGCVR